MTPLAIRNAIVSHVSANLATIQSGYTAADVAWPNKDFDPTGKTSFARLTIKPGGSWVGEVGRTGIGHRAGVVIMDIFVLKDAGERTGDAIAGNVESLFRRKSLSGVEFDEPYSETIGPEGDSDFYHIKVIAPFTTFVGE